MVITSPTFQNGFMPREMESWDGLISYLDAVDALVVVVVVHGIVWRKKDPFVVDDRGATLGFRNTEKKEHFTLSFTQV